MWFQNQKMFGSICIQSVIKLILPQFFLLFNKPRSDIAFTVLKYIDVRSSDFSMHMKDFSI